MDFITRLPVLTNWKTENYNSILVIVDWLKKMVHYEPVKITINTPELVEVIIDVMVQHHGLSNSIISNCGAIFTFKF